MGGWRAWKRQAGVGDLTPQPPLHEWGGGAKFTLLKGISAGEAGWGEAAPVWGRLSSLPVAARACLTAELGQEMSRDWPFLRLRVNRAFIGLLSPQGRSMGASPMRRRTKRRGGRRTGLSLL